MPCRRPGFKPVGETPTGVTETVVLPIFNGMVLVQDSNTPTLHQLVARIFLKHVFK